MGVGSRQAYRRLEQIFERASTLRSLRGLLGWDSNVVLPEGAATARGRQTAVVLDLLAQTLADPALPDLLGAAADADLDPWEAANLREMGREIRLNAATPPELAARLAEIASDCEMTWRGAKANSDFAQVRAPLEQLFAIAGDLAAARGEALGLSPFDAMMEAWEPGARCAALDGPFKQLVAVLPRIAMQAASDAPAAPAPERTWPPDVLFRAAQALAAHLGFSPTLGRLDASRHAFFMDDNPDDIRIGLRVDEGPLLRTLGGLIHEIGHARHEHNGPWAWRGQPVGAARSAAIQESQALLLEMIVGRSDAFWRQAAPAVARAIGSSATELAPSAIVTRLRQVRPGPLRVGADEVTYGLHIVLRYHLERDLIEGRLSVADLPDAWNSLFADLFGLAPPESDAQGCLQDIHWYSGLLGYFPSYAQGQWVSAQLAAAAVRDLPGLWDGDGQFDELAQWMRTHVHAEASRPTTDEMIQAATGAPLSPDALLNHLTQRYLGKALPD